MKSGKYFTVSTTIDQLPLTHPEHIGVTPVKITLVQGVRSRKSKKSFCKLRTYSTIAPKKKNLNLQEKLALEWRSLHLKLVNIRFCTNGSTKIH